MIRSALAALLLFVLHASVSPSRGGIGAGGRGDERIARAVALTTTDAPGLAERVVQGLARTVIERRSSGNGSGAPPAGWRNAPTTTREQQAPRAGHGGAYRTRRVPWPHQDAPYEAMAPPDGVLLP